MWILSLKTLRKLSKDARMFLCQDYQQDTPMKGLGNRFTFFVYFLVFKYELINLLSCEVPQAFSQKSNKLNLMKICIDVL